MGVDRVGVGEGEGRGGGLGDEEGAGHVAKFLCRGATLARIAASSKGAKLNTGYGFFRKQWDCEGVVECRQPAPASSLSEPIGCNIRNGLATLSTRWTASQLSHQTELSSVGLQVGQLSVCFLLCFFVA